MVSTVASTCFYVKVILLHSQLVNSHFSKLCMGFSQDVFALVKMYMCVTTKNGFKTILGNENYFYKRMFCIPHV